MVFETHCPRCNSPVDVSLDIGDHLDLGLTEALVSLGALSMCPKCGSDFDHCHEDKRHEQHEAIRQPYRDD
jgi:hypothetical protein